MDNLSQNFADLFRSHPLHTLYANMRAEAVILPVPSPSGGFEMPCTVVSRITPNCYTASPHAMMVDYGRDELVKLPSWQRLPLRGLLAALSGVLRLAQAERFAVLNNYGLSTNSFSRAFAETDLHALTAQACLKFPAHCLAIRSLNAVQNGGLMAQLSAAGWQMVATRQVYLICDWDQAFAKANSQRDQKLLADGRFVFERLDGNSPASAFQAAVACYNALYLHKYSRQNVQFTPLFLREAAARGILQLYLLRERATGEAAGVCGIVIDNGFATVPLIGYDTARPPRLGLYRRCMAQAMAVCRAHELHLNFSSGAPDFKKLRGAAPAIEYMAVYTAHLPKRRRLIWQVLRHLSLRYYVNILQKHGL